jgi:CRP-like cAMP-binding protein
VPFAEFYELILKAYNAGVLQGGGSLPLPTPPLLGRRWLPLSPGFAVSWAGVALAAVLGLLLAFPPTRFPGLLDVVYGWLATCAALSVGHALAASLLIGSGGEVLRPRFVWLTPFPHFTADLADACMLERPVRVGVALAPATPLLTLTALALGLGWEWGAVPLVASLAHLHPRSRMVEGFQLLLGRRPTLATDRDFVFFANRWPRRRLRAFLRPDPAWLVGFRLLAALIWVWMIVRVAYSLVGLPLVGTLGSPGLWQAALAVVAGAVGTAGFAVVTTIAAIAMQRRSARFIAVARDRAGRWKSPSAAELGEDALAATLARSPLFRSVERDLQTDAAARFSVRRHHAWATLVSPDQPPAEVTLIVKGEVGVYQAEPDGGRRLLRVLSEGDLIGTHAFVDPGRPALEVRSRTPVVGLALAAADFQKLVVDRIGPEATHRLAHTCSFLRLLPLCRGWQLSAVLRLSHLATRHTHAPGERILARGSEPWSFLIVEDGEVSLEREDTVRGRLGPGDCFGETDLLQNSATSVDLIARLPTRVLSVHRSDFLRFLTHNHHVALSIEGIAARRLGRPVFPLQTSFEVLGGTA